MVLTDMLRKFRGYPLANAPNNWLRRQDCDSQITASGTAYSPACTVRQAVKAQSTTPQGALPLSQSSTWGLMIELTRSAYADAPHCGHKNETSPSSAERGMARTSQPKA